MQNERPALQTALTSVGDKVFVQELKYNHGRGDTYWVTRKTTEKEVRELVIHGKIVNKELTRIANWKTGLSYQQLEFLTDGQLIDMIFE